MIPPLVDMHPFGVKHFFYKNPISPQFIVRINCAPNFTLLTREYNCNTSSTKKHWHLCKWSLFFSDRKNTNRVTTKAHEQLPAGGMHFKTWRNLLIRQERNCFSWSALMVKKQGYQYTCSTANADFTKLHVLKTNFPALNILKVSSER